MQRIELAKDARPGNIALANLNERIALMRQNLYKSADKTLHQGMAAVADLRQELGLTREYLGNVPVQEREFVDLRRQQGMMARLYNFLLEKQEENSMLLANSVSKGKVIDEAYTLSEPLGASPKIILLIAFVIGLVIPPAGLFLYKLLRNKFESRAEVERHVSAPILGEMVTDNSGRKLVVTEKDTSPSTELFRLLRSNLQFMLGGSADRVVLVTSTVSGEGKSFISANMAASLSLLENKRVLLMGMDIRNPQLENYLDIHPAKGLTNYLSSDNVSVDEITVHMPGYKSLDVMVAGPIPPNPSELLASSKVGSLFEMLRSKYDYIVVDSAPVGMVSDTFTLNRFADATIYVTRVNYSSMHDLRFIEEVYQNKRLKNLSVVVNGTAHKKGYGYGYGRKAGER
ncbi:MAG: polysaccharide biosynthesis tyrosine autokinase [Duncaniella sp.]|nr:polysaccharide biosynthesis tyrosine autokinase [Duncaniella sp.]